MGEDAGNCSSAWNRRRLLGAGLGLGLGLTATLASCLLRGDSTQDALSPLFRRCIFGASTDGSLQGHRRLEHQVGARLPMFSMFQGFQAWNRKLATAIAALDQNRIYDLMVTIEAFDRPIGNLKRGESDRYFADYFQAAATYPGDVIVRLFHESNGDWYPWAVANDRAGVSSVQEWREAWRRIVGIARTHHADNVKFLFCANHEDVGGVPIEDYWPGPDYVDLIGVDGYNWDWRPDGSPQRSAHDIIAPMYGRLSALHPEAPFVVGEIGSAGHPNESAWFEKLFTTRDFPRLSRLCFFNKPKERNWRLDSDAATLNVNRRYLREAPYELPRPAPG